MMVERFGTVTCARKNQAIGLAFPRAKLKSKEVIIRKKQDIYRKEMAKTSLGIENIDNKDHRWISTFKLHFHLVYVCPQKINNNK